METKKEELVLKYPYSKKVEMVFSVGMIVLSIVLVSFVFYFSFFNLAVLPLVVPSTFPFGIACIGLRGLWEASRT